MRKFPDIKQIEDELERVNYSSKYKRMIRSTIGILLVVAALAVLVATLWLPVLEIYGTSMTPTLTNGDIVVTVKQGEFEQGDIVAFYYNNKILVKRVIAKEFDYISIDDDGIVSVNGNVIDEPYISEFSLGDCNISFPYQVPEGQYFVMGDHRSISADSRKAEIGCISEEYIVGKLEFCIWPLKDMGEIN